MRREPPNQTNGGEKERPDAPSPGRHVLREPGKQTRRLGVRFITSAAAVLAVGAAAGLFLFLTQDSGQHAAQPSPEQGLACPYLQQASDAYERGDTVAFNKTTERAVKVAESTLQESGRTFGEAERIALELGLGNPKGAQELLRKAETVCSRLGRWDSPAGVTDAGDSVALSIQTELLEGSCPTASDSPKDKTCQGAHAGRS
jgi:hypothetical protein